MILKTINSILSSIIILIITIWMLVTVVSSIVNAREVPKYEICDGTSILGKCVYVDEFVKDASGCIMLSNDQGREFRLCNYSIKETNAETR